MPKGRHRAGHVAGHHRTSASVRKAAPGARKAPPEARRASPTRVGGARVEGRRLADGGGRPAVLTALGSGRSSSRWYRWRSCPWPRSRGWRRTEAMTRQRRHLPSMQVRRPLRSGISPPLVWCPRARLPRLRGPRSRTPSHRSWWETTPVPRRSTQSASRWTTSRRRRVRGSTPRRSPRTVLPKRSRPLVRAHRRPPQTATSSPGRKQPFAACSPASAPLTSSPSRLAWTNCSADAGA